MKILLLQFWYGLTDQGIEEALYVRLSFRRFVGLPLDAPAPDHSAIWRFRQKLQGERLEALLVEINRQLDALGLMVRKGTLIDATLLKAAAKPPRPSEGEVSAVDPQASAGHGARARPTSATRRIWRSTRARNWCAGWR